MHGTNGITATGKSPVKTENRLGIIAIPTACLNPKNTTEEIKVALTIDPTIN
jgi:hypothetical protein